MRLSSSRCPRAAVSWLKTLATKAEANVQRRTEVTWEAEAAQAPMRAGLEVRLRVSRRQYLPILCNREQVGKEPILRPIDHGRARQPSHKLAG